MDIQIPKEQQKRERRKTLVSEILNRHSAHYSLRTGTDGITRFVISLPMA